MGQNIQLRNDSGIPLYPNTISDYVYIDPITTLKSKTIKNIFIVNEYKGTDYEKIQKAIDECKAKGGGVVFLDGNYEISNTLKLDGDYVSLLSYNSAEIKLVTDDENLPLIRITNSNSSSGADSTCKEIRGISFKGVDRKGIGIVFGKTADDTVTYTSRDIIIRDCKFSDLNIGIDYTSNAYILTHEHISLGGCNTCVRMLEGFSNYGERIVFNNSTLCNSSMLVQMANGEGAFYFNNCSLDYSDQFIKCRAGNIYINSSHLEFRHLAKEMPWLIYCGGTNGHGSVIIKDSLLICTNPGNEKYEYLFYCDSGGTWADARFVIKVEDCRMIHWKTTSGYLCGGNDAGRFFITGSMCNQIPSINFKTKANQNLKNLFKVLHYDPTTCKYEMVEDTNASGETVKAFKITKLNYLGSSCIITIGLPNITSSINVAFYVKASTSTACWLNAGYRYSVAGKGYDVSALPTDGTYARHDTAYFFPINTNMDDYVISLDLNNADQNDEIYIYIDSAYIF